LLNERGMNVVARRIQISLCTALALVVVAGTAHADAPKLAALTKAYADKHGLPVRIVKSDLGTRQVERHFVPVLPTTHDDFLATFQRRERRGRVAHERARQNSRRARCASGRSHHVQQSAPRRAQRDAARDRWHVSHDRAQQRADRRVGRVHRQVHACRRAADPSGPAEFHARDEGDEHAGLRWLHVVGLAHADIGGKNLATAMGVRRAKGPEVLAPRLIHAGNELVGPIGIPVPNLEAFNALSDQQLMGPEPAGGAAEQVKE
jgi:hypothetical protein